MPPKRTVLVAGPAGAGKDAVARLLQERGGDEVTVARFAGPVKRLLAWCINELAPMDRPLTEADFEDPGLKQRAVGGRGARVRELMQGLADEVKGALSDPDVFAQALLRRTAGAAGTVVVPDLRYDAEADAVRASRGAAATTVLRVERPAAERPRGLTDAEARHSSESGVSARVVDAVIRNDGAGEDGMWPAVQAALAARVAAGGGGGEGAAAAGVGRAGDGDKVFLFEHPRNARIRFVDTGPDGEKVHYYLVDGRRVGFSVSALVAMTKTDEFVPAVALRKMKGSRAGWPRAAYADVTPEGELEAWPDARILRQWTSNGARAADSGTAAHGLMERYGMGQRVRLESPRALELEGAPRPDDPPTARAERALARARELAASGVDAVRVCLGVAWLETQRARGLEVFETEGVFWGGGAKGGRDVPVGEAAPTVCGSCDLILRDPADPPGVVHLKDYKFSDVLTKPDKFHNTYRSLDLVDGLPDCTWGKWAVQINLYRHLLETYYGLTVKSMSMVVLHENLVHEGPREYFFKRVCVRRLMAHASLKAHPGQPLPPEEAPPSPPASGRRPPPPAVASPRAALAALKRART